MKIIEIIIDAKGEVIVQTPPVTLARRVPPQRRPTGRRACGHAFAVIRHTARRLWNRRSV